MFLCGSIIDGNRLYLGFCFNQFNIKLINIINKIYENL